MIFVSSKSLGIKIHKPPLQERSPKQFLRTLSLENRGQLSGGSGPTYLGEAVLRDRGSSQNTLKNLFQTVRTPQANLVGEKHVSSIFLDLF